MPALFNVATRGERRSSRKKNSKRRKQKGGGTPPDESDVTSRETGCRKGKNLKGQKRKNFVATHKHAKTHKYIHTTYIHRYSTIAIHIYIYNIDIYIYTYIYTYIYIT